MPKKIYKISIGPIGSIDKIDQKFHKATDALRYSEIERFGDTDEEIIVELVTTIQLTHDDLEKASYDEKNWVDTPPNNSQPMGN